jgi:hypothetical protein
MNSELSYYQQQAGTGIAFHTGVRFQKGHGFFGRLLQKAIYPLMRILGNTALSTGADIAQDVLDKKDFKESLKTRAEEAGRKLAKRGIDKVREYAQEGTGGKRYKKTGVLNKKKAQRNVNKKKPKSTGRKKRTLSQSTRNSDLIY